MKLIGAHVSAAGGVWNAPANASALGATAFALFTKNQRQWKARPLSDEDILMFKAAIQDLGFKAHQILPHDSYLINLAHPESDKWNISVDAFLNECRRCEKLGLSMLNFHPGATLGKSSESEGIKRIAEAMNRVLQETEFISLIIENTAGQGSSLGYKFEHLRDLIDLSIQPGRIGICLDTCHTFAAGYDIRTAESFQNVLNKFDTIVGLKRIKGFHLNDSKKELGTRVDRHAPLGGGEIGWAAFRFLISHPVSDNIPLILETPQPEKWPEEIQTLNKFWLEEGR